MLTCALDAEYFSADRLVVPASYCVCKSIAKLRNQTVSPLSSDRGSKTSTCWMDQC
jgi:hypothetical protein